MKNGRQKKITAALCANIMLFSVIFAGSCAPPGREECLALRLTTVQASALKLQYAVEQFNASQTEYCIETTVLAEGSLKDYNFSHGAIETDLISFENFNDANKLSSLLQPLNREEALGNYQISLLNHLRTEDGTLYVIPAPGIFYSQCLNQDIFDKQNYSVPDTVDELITLAQRIFENGVSHACSVVGGDRSLSSILMGVAVPAFGSSVHGIDFLKRFYAGKTTLTDGSYQQEWRSIFENYRSLYRASFFDLNDIYAPDEESLQEFFDGMTLAFHNSPDIDLENLCKERDVKFDYRFYPFIGNMKNQQWIVVQPRYYLGATRAAYADKQKRAGIQAFLQYYTSEEGQDAAERDEKGVSRKDSISFIKDFGQEFKGAYAPLETSFRFGRVFLADTFTSIFEKVPRSLEAFLRDEIGIAELMKEIDDTVLTEANKLDEEYTIEADFDYGPAVCERESSIGNFVADAVRTKAETTVTAVLLPAGMLRANLFAGAVRESELSVAFRDEKLAVAKISGAGLKKILLEALEAKGTENYPLISGLRLSGSGNRLTIKLLNGKNIGEEDVISLLLPKSWTEKYRREILSVGSESSALALLKTYLKENGARPSQPDGRMGGA